MPNGKEDYQSTIFAARDEIMRRGLKFTMDSLARRLRISKKTLYQSICSKEELIEKVVDSALESITENEARIFHDPELSLNAQLLFLIELYHGALQPFDKETMLEMMERYPEQWEKIEQFRLAKWQSVITMMHLHLAKGDLKRIDIEMIMSGILIELLLGGRSGKGSTVDILIKELTDLFQETESAEDLRKMSGGICHESK